METKLKKAIGDPTQTIYGALAHVLAKKFLPLTPVSDVEGVIPRIDERDPSALAIISGFFAQGWEFSGDWMRSCDFDDVLLKQVEELANPYGVVRLPSLAAALGTTEELLALYCTDRHGYIRLGDYVLTVTGNYADRCAAVLSIRETPLTVLDMATALGEPHSRSITDQLSKDPRLVKVSTSAWGLSEWGMEEFTNVADWIGDHIDQSSEPVRVSTLLAACDKLGVAESTVRLLANNGEFITRDGVVTRGSDTAPVLGNPAEAANLYFRDDDYFSLLTVNKDHLRGSSFAVHRSVGARYGLLFLQEVTLSSRLGPQYLRSTRTTNVTVSTIRRWLEEVGSTEGDRVWLHFGKDQTFDIRPATRLVPDGGLLNRLGLDDWIEPGDNDLQTINRALGLSADAPRRRTVAIFRHRHQDDIADEIAAWA